MAYIMRYDGEANVLTLIAAEEGRLSHLKELGDFVIHFGEKGTPLFLEILRTSKVLPIMMETLSKKETFVH